MTLGRRGFQNTRIPPLSQKSKIFDSMNYGVIAPGNHWILIRCAEHHPDKGSQGCAPFFYPKQQFRFPSAEWHQNGFLLTFICFML